MSKPSIPNNIRLLIKYFTKNYVYNDKINEIFYYSLFDTHSFRNVMEEDSFLYKMIEDNKNQLKRLLQPPVFPKTNPFLKNKESFNKFEKNIVAKDKLSRILLKVHLTSNGINSEFSGSDDFDLEIKKGEILLELKRIWAWGAYDEYTNKFIAKVKKSHKKRPDSNYLYVVAGTHPFIYEELFAHKIEIFNRYIGNIIESHNVGEMLLNQKNVKFVVGYINQDGKDDHNLANLCDVIIEKVHEFKEGV